MSFCGYFGRNPHDAAQKTLMGGAFFFFFLWTTIQICMARFLHSSASQRCWMGLEGRAACTPIKFLHIRLGKRTVFMELEEASFMHPLHTEIDTLSASVASDNDTYGDGGGGTAGHPVIVRSLVLFSSVFLKLTKKIYCLNLTKLRQYDVDPVYVLLLRCSSHLVLDTVIRGCVWMENGCSSCFNYWFFGLFPFFIIRTDKEWQEMGW